MYLALDKSVCQKKIFMTKCNCNNTSHKEDDKVTKVVTLAETKHVRFCLCFWFGVCVFVVLDKERLDQ